MKRAPVKSQMVENTVQSVMEIQIYVYIWICSILYLLVINFSTSAKRKKMQFAMYFFQSGLLNVQIRNVHKTS